MTTTNQKIEKQIEFLTHEFIELRNETKSLLNRWSDYIAEYNLKPTLDEMIHLKRCLRNSVEALEDRLYQLKEEENRLAVLYNNRKIENKSK